MTSGRADVGGGTAVPLSVWLLLVALAYATLQQGGFHRGPFRACLVLVLLAAVAHVVRSGVPRWSDLAPRMALPALGAIGATVLVTEAGLHAALPAVAVVAMVLIVVHVVSAALAAALARVLDGVVLCGLLASATAWVGVVLHREPWALVAQGIWRGSSTVTYANATGALVGVALLVALARPRSSRHRLAAVPAYALAVGLLATGSRAALLAVAMGLLVLARRHGLRPVAAATLPVAAGALAGAAGLVPSLSAAEPAQPLLAAVGLLVGAVVTVVLSSAWHPRVVAGAVVLVVALTLTGARHDLDLVTSARVDLTSSDRADEWRAATDELRSSPLVGVGPGRLDLRWAGDDGRIYVAAYTHNEYLELAATYGLVGVAALTACVVLVRRRPGRGHRSPDRDGAAAALAVLAVHSGLDFLWHVPVLALVGGVLVGVLTADDHRPPDPPTDRSPTRALETVR